MQLFPGQTEVAERPGILTYPEAGAIINRCLFSFDKNSPSEEKVGSQTGVAGAGSALPRGLSSGWVSETHRGWSVCGGKHAYPPPPAPRAGVLPGGSRGGTGQAEAGPCRGPGPCLPPASMPPSRVHGGGKLCVGAHECSELGAAASDPAA